MKKSKTVKLGSFVMNSGTVIASDPCYSTDTWCLGVLSAAKGVWQATVTYVDKKNWGTRVAQLMITATQETPIGMWDNVPETFGVDSGQFGFFDLASYKPPKIRTTKFYKECCEITLADNQAGILPGGVVSSSGFGDGCYQVLGRKNAKGEYVALKVKFI